MANIFCFLVHQIQVRARERSLCYGLILSESALMSTLLRNKASVIPKWFTNQPEASGYFQLTLEHGVQAKLLKYVQTLTVL